MEESANTSEESGQILFLPAEILEHIWLCSCLEISDIGRLAAVCTKFNHVSTSNEVWKQKLDKRWPNLLSRYPQHGEFSWREECRKRGEVSRTVRTIITRMSPRFIQFEEVPKSGFTDFGDVQDPERARLVIDALLEIYRDQQSHKNLTEKYYTEKALAHVQQLHLQREWQQFLQQPPERQRLEKGIVLVTQWCQPTHYITEREVSLQLDSIARQVLHHITRSFPQHPIIKTVKDNGFYTDASPGVMTPKQLREILESLNHVFYSELGFHGNEEEFYDPKNSYINEVLSRKKGIPISLAVVYSSVARRLGVECQPVNFPAHFLLKWVEHPALEGGEEFTYIDVFHEGRFLTEYECCNLLDLHIHVALGKDHYEAIPPAKVFERMARNLVNIGRQQGQMADGLRCLRNSVELLLTICPEDMDARILQARLYLHLSINHQEVIDILKGLSAVEGIAPTGLISYLMMTAGQQLAEQQNLEQKEVVPKKWSESIQVKFSVGLIMKHKRYDYICVVYGWDAECEATQEWILQMGVHNLPQQQHQPFYNVLVEDGSNRYAAQVNLELAAEPKVVTHPEVGRYFKEFCGTHYLPNAEKLAQYPEDMAVTLSQSAEKYG